MYNMNKTVSFLSHREGAREIVGVQSVITFLHVRILLILSKKRSFWIFAYILHIISKLAALICLHFFICPFVQWYLERRGALQIDLLSGTRVAEAQRFRMNTHCLAAVCISVYAVSDDGVADGAAVNIELVGASGNAGKADVWEGTIGNKRRFRQKATGPGLVTSLRSVPI